MKSLAIVPLLLLSLAFVADKPLADRTQEARAQEVIHQLRCFVCEGQPLAQSHVPLAQDLRQLVRRLIEEGSSNQDVLDFITARYGTEVLLNPPLKAATAFLWAAPFLFFLLLGVWFLRMFFKKAK